MAVTESNNGHAIIILPLMQTTEENHKQSLPIIGLNLNQYLLVWFNTVVLLVNYSAFTFKQLGWYLNFSTWFMKNIL
jgi:hypothetical protein